MLFKTNTKMRYLEKENQQESRKDLKQVHQNVKEGMKGEAETVTEKSSEKRGKN